MYFWYLTNNLKFSMNSGNLIWLYNFVLTTKTLLRLSIFFIDHYKIFSLPIIYITNSTPIWFTYCCFRNVDFLIKCLSKLYCCLIWDFHSFLYAYNMRYSTKLKEGHPNIIRFACRYHHEFDVLAIFRIFNEYFFQVLNVHELWYSSILMFE
jgi:hypothetical protein